MNRMLVTMMLALSGLASCGVDPVPPAAPSPISPEEAERIARDPQFIETSATLASDGYHAVLDQGLVYRRSGEYAAVFPVASRTDDAAAYRAVTYREVDGQVLVFVERDEAAPSSKGGSPDIQNLSCGGWSGWTSLNATWCDGSLPSCLWEGFRATYDRQWRGRQCCDSAAHCWLETEYQNVITKCGC